MRQRALLVAVILAVPSCAGGGTGSDAVQQGPATTFADPGVVTFADEGLMQVPAGTDVRYSTDPPTSGPSYPVPEPGGFYADPVAPGFLVASLARGGVVIYYNPAPLTAPDLDTLRLLAEAHPGDALQVVVVPRPDPVNAVVLTAWTHLLPLPEFDLSRIDNFLALFLGKGPGNS